MDERIDGWMDKWMNEWMTTVDSHGGAEECDVTSDFEPR